MSTLEDVKALQEGNLAVGGWVNKDGKEHVSLTRMGRYNKNIAVPVDLVPAVIREMQARYDEIKGE